MANSSKKDLHLQVFFVYLHRNTNVSRSPSVSFPDLLNFAVPKIGVAVKPFGATTFNEQGVRRLLVMIVTNSLPLRNTRINAPLAWLAKRKGCLKSCSERSASAKCDNSPDSPFESCDIDTEGAIQ